MAQHLRKPDWLKIRLGGNEQFTKTKSIVRSVLALVVFVIR